MNFLLLKNMCFGQIFNIIQKIVEFCQICIKISNKPISNNIVMIFVEFIQTFPNISRILTVPHGLQTFTDPTSQDEGRRQ